MPLVSTFGKHPLLSKLSFQPQKELTYCCGLHVNNLKMSQISDLYIIDINTLEKVFSDRCHAGDLKSIKMLVEFDYTQLSTLSNNHPFFIQSNPFSIDNATGMQNLLNELDTANYIGKNEVSLYLIEKLMPWLKIQLNSSCNFLSDNVMDALCAVAVYQPNLAHEKLTKEISGNFKLDEKTFSNKNYTRLLEVLEIIGSEANCFEFATKKLLNFAIQEAKMEISDRYSKAIHHFTGLFLHNGVRTKVGLKDRKIYLESFLSTADSHNNYDEMRVLLRTLGLAANVFASGEEEHVKDEFQESYMHFAIDRLIHFVVTNHVLAFIAEKELLQLLDLTIDEPDIWCANDVPFRIFRFFLETKRLWNTNPFEILNKLKDLIDALKKDNNDHSNHESIKQLELRLQQFISLVGNRNFVSEDFTLYLSSKNENKICEIGVFKDQNTELDLHERQSLAERLIFKGKTNLHDIGSYREKPHYSFLIGNFGLVITDRPHNKGGTHRRTFKSIPIKIAGLTITGRKGFYGGHAEEAFYNYLCKQENVVTLLASFLREFDNKAANHKVYAVVLDLHGTYDMCLSCSTLGLNFQDSFRIMLLQEFQNQNIKILTKHPHQLYMIIRYSSDLRYHHSNYLEDKKRGILTLLEVEGQKRDLSSNETSKKYPLANKDIKLYGANLLIHGKQNWHTFWNRKQYQYNGPMIPLESWTAFTTDRHVSNLSQEQMTVDYTKSGVVTTMKSDDSTPSLRFTNLTK